MGTKNIFSEFGFGQGAETALSKRLLKEIGEERLDKFAEYLETHGGHQKLDEELDEKIGKDLYNTYISKKFGISGYISDEDAPRFAYMAVKDTEHLLHSSSYNLDNLVDIVVNYVVDTN